VLAGGELPFAEEKVDELALAGSVRLDELGKVPVRPHRRSGRQEGTDDAVEVGLKVVESAGELPMVRARPVGSDLEFGRETDGTTGRVPGAERPLDRELDLTTARGHGA
jgi:hypothetical protein